jgi:Ribbon-helix-helix protein, copG family
MGRKNPFALTSIRLPFSDVESWKSAAARLGISQSEFLRQALREKANAMTVGQRNEPPPVDDERNGRRQ